MRPELTGRTTFELDGAFLRQTADTTPADDAPDAWHTNAPRQTTAVIGVDGANGDMTVLYSDSRGVARIYQMSLSQTEWRIGATLQVSISASSADLKTTEGPSLGARSRRPTETHGS